jgi:polyhydroxyalkanoate synthase
LTKVNIGKRLNGYLLRISDQEIGMAAQEVNSVVGQSETGLRKSSGREGKRGLPPKRVSKVEARVPRIERSTFAEEQDLRASAMLSEILDRSINATTARFTGGLSPAALMGAYADWSLHLARSPGKRWQLIEKAIRKWVRLINYACGCAMQTRAEPCIEPLPQDKRFRGEAWQEWPYNIIYQSFLLGQQWWYNATTDVRGVTEQHSKVVEFATRQILDVFSPSNFLLTNPELLERTMREGGLNFLQGARNFAEDFERFISGKKPVGTERFRPGREVAVTPGKVVFRNRLIELIQYEPSTTKVRPEPVLIVPAWIMKYYILDLSPDNSLVKYLIEQGYTVFMVSWKNPEPEDRDIGLEAYRLEGVMAALDVITEIVPGRKVHATGYCIGGTLLAIAAAAMARERNNRLCSITFFATQTDFTEAGELMLFINESEISFLEDMMWAQGFLDAKQMAGTFQLLRSNDLIWSRVVHEYLMGERAPMFDLMAWNADATRLPYRMQSEYLRKLFLENELSEGRYEAGGRPVALTDIRAPIFAVSTQQDHVAPWHSVYKIHLLTDTEVTFLLTSGGHNAGIISEPGHEGRSYQVTTKSSEARYVDPDTWAKRTAIQQGSWWLEWVRWLDRHSDEFVAPPSMGSVKYEPLYDAPGDYVFGD